MPTLAPKLPYTHPFAGGYPRIGGQALPTDPDAIDYLERVAAADGAAVEVGVAMAVDAFVKGCKADGIWDAIKASCIMCGARTISGALVPLVGTAPTPYNFAGGDYDRTTGLIGDGSTKYLDSNRASDADGQDDAHMSLYISQAHSGASIVLCGSRTNTPVSFDQINTGGANADIIFGIRSEHSAIGDERVAGAGSATGFVGVARSSDGEFRHRVNAATTYVSEQSVSPTAYNQYIFGRNNEGSVDSRTTSKFAFYSIGSSLDLAALDTRVSTLVSAIGAAL